MGQEMNEQSLELPPEKIPRHVAIIMDGNGRWAQQRGLPRLAGHRAGTDNLRRILEASVEFGIEILTIYAFSTENWNRPPREVRGLMSILERVIDREERTPLVNVVFNRPEEFFDELGQDLDHIDRSIVRVTRVYEAASIGSVKRLSVEASALVHGRYIYRLKATTGMVWNIGGHEDDETERRADELIRRITTFCSEQGLTLRTGHLAP